MRRAKSLGAMPTSSWADEQHAHEDVGMAHERAPGWLQPGRGAVKIDAPPNAACRHIARLVPYAAPALPGSLPRARPGLGPGPPQLEPAARRRGHKIGRAAPRRALTAGRPHSVPRAGP